MWITSAKQAEKRKRRIENACSMLAAGKRRVCCFDRSGIYNKRQLSEEFAVRNDVVHRKGKAESCHMHRLNEPEIAAVFSAVEGFVMLNPTVTSPA